jgi:endonuclease-3
VPKSPQPSPVPAPSAKRRARSILQRLKKRYPDIGTALEFSDPWQLLVATVMSAQTTDDTVNRTTPILFARYPSPADLAAANPEEVEQIIYPTGFFRQKTKSIIRLSTDLTDRFGGEVPMKLEDLVTLHGVGRKTASVVLTEAFKAPAIAVDTHVKRVAGRLDLTVSQNPVRIEMDLRALYPRKEWVGVSMRFIQFGRDICDAQRPLCRVCELNRICRWPGKRLRLN